MILKEFSFSANGKMKWEGRKGRRREREKEGEEDGGEGRSELKETSVYFLAAPLPVFAWFV